MQPDFKGFLSYAKQQLPELNIKGMHYAIAPSQLRKGKVPWMCFDIDTNNPYFFGQEYSNARRVKILDMLYEKLFDKAASLGNGEAFLDFYTHLQEPYQAEETHQDKKLTEGTVDVTNDNSVKFVNLAGAVHKDEIQTGSAIEECCSNYGIKDVLMHGFHTIAPDPSTAEVFEALTEAKKISSAIEIGGGVGTTGYAAMARGLTDFTFVDLNNDVCKYLGAKLPYPVVNASAFDFKFDRDYDALVVGVPYELVPQLLEKKGQEISDHVGTMIVQSGCAAFFQHEHDWVFGRENQQKWPWWKPEQTASHYFLYGIDGLIGFQTIIAANHNHEDDFRLEEELSKRSMKDISYNHVALTDL